MNFFFHIGRYFMMLAAIFSKPEKMMIYRRMTIHEIMSLGINSISIVAIISVFMGAVITMQTASMIDAAWIPDYTLGYTTRQSTILEFSPTIISLILAGKVGSNIAGEIGTMRVTEQIDALEIMGVNSRAYLILPKVIGFMFILPFLVIFSMFLSIFGGWFVSEIAGLASGEVYILGIRAFFEPFTVTYALTKAVAFAFVITTVSAYYGYYTTGGALDVGKSGTQAVVASSIVILIVNYLITQFMLL